MATTTPVLTDVQDGNRRRAIGQDQSFTGGTKASGFQGGQIDTTTKNLREGLETDVSVGSTVTPVAAKPPAIPAYTAPKPKTPLATVEPSKTAATIPGVQAGKPVAATIPAVQAPAPVAPPVAASVPGVQAAPQPVAASLPGVQAAPAPAPAAAAPAAPAAPPYSFVGGRAVTYDSTYGRPIAVPYSQPLQGVTPEFQQAVNKQAVDTAWSNYYAKRSGLQLAGPSRGMNGNLSTK